MQVTELLNELGYRDSPNFLRKRQGAFESAPYFGHIFRRARANLGLEGVYALRSDPEAATGTVVPLVYVCRAPSEEDANDLHRLVWNQDVAPFVIVHTPSGVKLYSGFRHSRSQKGEQSGVLQALTDFNKLSTLIEEFGAKSIDTGNIWRHRGKDVTPEDRVDLKLLANLRKLDRLLRENGLMQEQSHAIIGKYVYLHYLRDRGILSAKKLKKWGLTEPSIFGREATVEAVREVVRRLDEWLNGSIFPIDFASKDAPKAEHLRVVAGVFSGDEISEVGDRQLSLDFQCYDFSYIPIETLSNVYEQFLHAPDDANKPGRGRDTGAYYTPIPVVNLIISELEERRPLTRETRVFDPACGSGAFLVQCYRRLIEKELPPKSKPTPPQLRELLERTIFGVDMEEDACNVAELSLVLTLLDYVNPPDLEGVGQTRFQLPALRGKNIFWANFFEKPEEKYEPLTKKFRWIVGNPPWKRLNPQKLQNAEKAAWSWMTDNAREQPVGGNQVARAFAWKVLVYLADEGEVGLFLPAMTLFEDPARDFRRAFFHRVRVNTVANLSNLAEVLAPGRFRVPAAAFFYEKRSDGLQELDEDEAVRVYSPLVANQEPTRPTITGKRNESWSIVVNASEIRDIPTIRVADGNGLPWKLATWGSTLDERLLNKLTNRFDSIGDLERQGRIIASQGLELRPAPRNEDEVKEVELVEEVVGKNILDVAPMKGLRHVFSFPPAAVVPLEAEFTHVRKGRAGLPLSVCRPPHVIVSAARNFAVYEERYLVVPPRQIGIVSPMDEKQFLKALSLYLSSDFAFYHQFLTSSQFGVQRGRATLNALRNMPVPVSNLSAIQRTKWESLHSRLARTTPQPLRESRESASADQRQLSLLPDDEKTNSEANQLLRELNDLVNDSLELNAGERSLVYDLVHVRLALNDGKTGKPAVRSPKTPDLRAYGQRLKSELDDFINGELPKRHQVAIIYDRLSGMVQVDLISDTAAAREVKVIKADDSTASQLEETRGRLRAERSQWVYFDRNLRIYEGTRTYLFKPMQRIHWTESQAMIDARNIIAETLG
jgi:hypothetical protein